MEKMRFIFTEKSFYLEEGGLLSGELQAWQEEFIKDKEYAWYLLGLKGCPPDADTVAGLEAAVPFVIGAEYLDGKWVGRACAGAYFLSSCGERGNVPSSEAYGSGSLSVPERNSCD